MSSGEIAVGQIAITVADVPAALGFYRDILGLQHLFSPSDDLAFLACGAIRIMLSTPQGAGEAGANSIIYFSVDDIEASYADIVRLGAVVERPPQLAAEMPDHDIWIGFVRDPEDNLVGLMEEKPR